MAAGAGRGGAGAVPARSGGESAATRRRGELAAQHARQSFTWAQAAGLAAQRIEALGRIIPDAAAVTAPKAAPAAPVKITLPPAALMGHLAEARELVRQKKSRAAWEAVLAALAKRPFHPEAYLLLAEIALNVGDGRPARLCAEHARHLAPGWKPAKKLLNQRFNGAAQPEWLKLPAELRTPEAERRPPAERLSHRQKRGEISRPVPELGARAGVATRGGGHRFDGPDGGNRPGTRRGSA